MQAIGILLILILALPAVGFVISLAGMAVAAAAERAQRRRIGFAPGARPFSLTLGDAFDARHALLWSTQLSALRLVAAGGASGVAYRDLYRLSYEPSARRYPELYEGSSFAEWLFCLENAKLISLGSKRVVLTPLGESFLEYCPAELAMPA